ncbi:MAG: glycosyltransferase family 39 protein [Bacteroidota bacterium]|nr:glycosyltransferase family 39 protein [Bacteroidota bacterium]
MKNKIILLAVLCTLGMTFFAFLPALHNGWTSWDDGEYVIDNPDVHGMTIQNVENIFSTSYVGTYLPVTMLTYAINYDLHGFDPFGYHLVNILIHVVNAGLVFWFVFRFTGGVTTAFIVSVLFGIHPLHVEPVAWISGRKDLLSTTFQLGSLILYLSYLASRKRKDLWIAFGLFIMALLSKGNAIMLPLLLLLFDINAKRSDQKEMLREKIPFVVLAFLVVVVGFISQHSGHALRLHNPPFANVLIASRGIIFYVVKIIFPLHLSNLYPYPQDFPKLPLEYYLSLPGVIVLFFVVIKAGKKYPILLFGSLFFIINLLPVLQLVPMGSAVAADRYVYFSSVGIFLIIGAGIEKLLQSEILKRWVIVSVMVALMTGVIVFYSALTWEQCKVWKDNSTLWEHLRK